MSYIPSQLAALKLDELRRQAGLERQSRQAIRTTKPRQTRPVRRPSLELPLPSLRRAVSEG